MNPPEYKNKANAIWILGKNKEVLDYLSQSPVFEPAFTR